MGTNNKRPIFPLLLIAAGLILLIGAVVGIVFLSEGDDSQKVSVPNQDIPYPQVERVDLSIAKVAFDTGEAVFVDVRDLTYYENGHIPGALSIPLSQFEQRLNELDPNDWIILYCTWPSEETSARAASILIANGYSEANPILGGLQAWNGAGYPIKP